MMMLHTKMKLRLTPPPRNQKTSPLLKNNPKLKRKVRKRNQAESQPINLQQLSKLTISSLQ
jgi:hypothetical protein